MSKRFDTERSHILNALHAVMSANISHAVREYFFHSIFPIIVRVRSMTSQCFVSCLVSGILLSLSLSIKCIVTVILKLHQCVCYIVLTNVVKFFGNISFLNWKISIFHYFNVFYSMIKSTNYLFLTRIMLQLNNINKINTTPYRNARNTIGLNVSSTERDSSSPKVIPITIRKKMSNN